MLKVRANASTQENNMYVKPLRSHLHPDTKKFDHWVLDLYQDQAVGFMAQMAIAGAQDDP